MSPWLIFGVGLVLYIGAGFGLALLMMKFAEWVNR